MYTYIYATGALDFLFVFPCSLSGEHAAVCIEAIVSTKRRLGVTVTKVVGGTGMRASVIEASSSALKRCIFEAMGGQGSKTAAGPSTEYFPQRESFTAGWKGALLFLTR